MNKILSVCLKAVPTSAFFAGLFFNTCFADPIFSYKDLNFGLRSSFNFTKTNSTFEDRDKGDYKGTAPTSSWRSNKKLTTFVLNPRITWKIPSTHFFAQVSGRYGWVIDGKSVGYPLRWDIDGYVRGLGFKTGYILNVCDRFDFIPYGGIVYRDSNTTIFNQHFAKTSPNCYICQNGNKTSSMFFFPYVGIELAFSSDIFGCKKVQFASSYELGYGWGHSHTKVPRFILTDTPNTSRYGSHTKYRDLISHDFAIAAAYPIAKQWRIGLELDYSTTYNTHTLPVKLQHNNKIVKAGQFTKSQYHVISEDNSQTFSIIVGVVYSFGEGTDWITR